MTKAPFFPKRFLPTPFPLIKKGMAVKGNCLVPEGRLNKLLQKKLLLLVVWLGSEIDLFDL